MNNKLGDLMYYYDDGIFHYFNKFLNNAITFIEFEEWLRMNNDWLKGYFGEEIYFSLINIDFSSTNAEHLMKDNVQQIVNTPTYEHVRITELLTELVEQEAAYVKCCREIYEDYCNGLEFLREIALAAICYDYDHRLDMPDNINGLLQARETIIQEASMLLDFMEKGKLKILQENYYIDSR